MVMTEPQLVTLTRIVCHVVFVWMEIDACHALAQDGSGTQLLRYESSAQVIEKHVNLVLGV